MPPLSLSAIVVCNLVLTFQGLTDAALVRRFNYDARIYEHFAYDSRYIQFSRTDPELWANLTTLVDSRNFTFQSMICTFGPGAWIFYPEAGYEMGHRQIYYIVIGEHCIRSDDIYSVQPLGKMDEIMDQGVLLFSKINFGSVPTVIEGDGSGDAKSLIFTGPESFTLSGGSAKYCVTPEHSEGYCIMPDLLGLKIEGSATISANCSDDLLEDSAFQIIVHDCYTDGVHEIYHDSDMTAPKLKDVCGGGGSAFDKGKFTLVMEMWAKRLEKDYVNPRGEILDPLMKLRLSVIWNVIDAFTKMCPSVDTIYTYLVGALFEKHIRNMWATQGSSGPEVGTMGANVTDEELEEWKMVYQWSEICKNDAVPVIAAEGHCRVPDKTNKGVDDATFGDEWYAIVNGHDFDPIIEQVWIMINSFIPACSHAQAYGTNDWNDMILMFNDNFLSPLTDVWSDPQDWLRVYTAVFHGYDIREEHQKVLDCFKATLMMTPAFDPIGRPRGFREHVSRNYLLPMFGEIHKKAGDKAGEASAAAGGAGAAAGGDGAAKKEKRAIPKKRHLGKTPAEAKANL